MKHNIAELPDILISRIAAGEVIERPASVVKELVENSIDSGAKNINIKIIDGGRSLVEVQDDGKGIVKEDLPLALKRHATSKLKNHNLLEIDSLGFRGEGLASISSVSKVKIISKYIEEDSAFSIESEGGVLGEIEPSNLSAGTIVSVKNLFYATPARLKFLKTEKTENNYIIDILKKISMAHIDVSFSLEINGKLSFEYESDSFSDFSARVTNILGADFLASSQKLDFSLDDYKISGYISVPTFNRANSNSIYSFVNGRPIRDKLIINAVRVAYQDYLSRDRSPVMVLFIEMPHIEVDVNVHPTKAEVRFRDGAKLRNILVTALKATLQESGFKASSETAEQAINYFAKNNESQEFTPKFPAQSQSNYVPANVARNNFVAQAPSFSFAAEEKNMFQPQAVDRGEFQQDLVDFPLGSAVAQLHKTYIVSQTKDGLILVDQHAAHERIVYETLKKKLENREMATQQHLFSEIVELKENEIDILLDYNEELYRFGIVIEKSGKNGVLIKETPMIFKEVNIGVFIKDLVDNLLEYGEALNLHEKITEIYGNHCCANAIRAGRVLSIVEMNDILRKMEKTPFSGQCNHGRPTYVELKKKDLEKLFDRT